MLAIIMKQYKILNSVIGFVPIYMMDVFGRLEISTNLFFHYQPMFSDVIFVSKRMVVDSNHDISTFRCIDSALPVWIEFLGSFRAFFPIIPSSFPKHTLRMFSIGPPTLWEFISPSIVSDGSDRDIKNLRNFRIRQPFLIKQFCKFFNIECSRPSHIYKLIDKLTRNIVSLSRWTKLSRALLTYDYYGIAF